MHNRRLPLPILAVLACSACAGNGEGLDQNGRPGDGSSELTATFQSIQDNVFTPICTTCHIGASAPQGLRLDAANSYNMLVGIPSAEVPGAQRVAPGDPQNSYLIQKLEGRAAVGAQMPLGGPPLPPATIAVIRQWITDGAQAPAGSSLGKASGAAQEPEPAADGVLLQVLANGIIVGFDRQLDASLVNAATITLQRRIGEDSFEDVPAQAALNSANSAVILIAPQAALAAGQYRLLVQGSSGGVALADMSGQPLGRDYVFEFGLEASR